MVYKVILALLNMCDLSFFPAILLHSLYMLDRMQTLSIKRDNVFFLVYRSPV